MTTAKKTTKKTTCRTTTKRTRSRKSKTFSWKRVLGWSQIKQRLSRELGIPLTRAGVERRIGNFIVGLLFPKKSKRKSSKLYDGDADQQ